MAPDTSTATDADALAALADIERLGAQLRAARSAIGKVIYGQQDVIDQTLVALLSGGHVLLIGFRPEWRGQPFGTFRVLFNAALFSR